MAGMLGPNTDLEQIAEKMMPAVADRRIVHSTSADVEAPRVSV